MTDESRKAADLPPPTVAAEEKVTTTTESTVTVTGSSDNQRAIGRRASDEALAGSTPDLAHNFIRVSESLVNSDRPFKVLAGTSLLGLLLFFTIGLSAMVGSALLIDKWNEGATARRGFELDMFKIQSDIELKKMDRTMLGDGAMKTLISISEKLDGQDQKLDAQGVAVAEQGLKLEKVIATVDGLSRQQRTLAGDQADIRRQMQPVKPLSR